VIALADDAEVLDVEAGRAQLLDRRFGGPMIVEHGDDRAVMFHWM